MPSTANKIIPEAAAMPVGRAPDPDSFAQQIARLDIDETASRAVRLPAISTTVPTIREAKAKMRNVISGQVHKVKAKAECKGFTFTTSIGQFTADDGDTLVVMTVTRLT